MQAVVLAHSLGLLTYGLEISKCKHLAHQLLTWLWTAYADQQLQQVDMTESDTDMC